MALHNTLSTRSSRFLLKRSPPAVHASSGRALAEASRASQLSAIWTKTVATRSVPAKEQCIQLRQNFNLGWAAYKQGSDSLDRGMLEPLR